MSDNQLKVAPLTFSKNGWSYTQIWRENDLAIYAQGGVNRPAAYELHIIRKSAKDRVFPSHTTTNASGESVTYPESVIPAGSEFLAGNGDFGQFAWTYHTLGRAMTKVDDLKKRVKRVAKQPKP
jgi:hypothetical protein